MVRKGLSLQKTLSKQTENGCSFFMAFRVFPKGWLRSSERVERASFNEKPSVVRKYNYNVRITVYVNMHTSIADAAEGSLKGGDELYSQPSFQCMDRWGEGNTTQGGKTFQHMSII